MEHTIKNMKTATGKSSDLSGNSALEDTPLRKMLSSRQRSSGGSPAWDYAMPLLRHELELQLLEPSSAIMNEIARTGGWEKDSATLAEKIKALRKERGSV